MRFGKYDMDVHSTHDATTTNIKMSPATVNVARDINMKNW